MGRWRSCWGFDGRPSKCPFLLLRGNKPLSNLYLKRCKNRTVTDSQCNASKNAAVLLSKQSSSGAEPVRKWLKVLDEPDRQSVGQPLMRAQWRWPAGMPLCRAMGQGPWEVCTDLPSHRIARVLLCLHEGGLVTLHGFIEKTQKTPDDELAFARKQKKG